MAKGKSHLEESFLLTWNSTVSGSEPVQQHRFAAPERQWRFDFAWPDALVAVEIDGGIFVGGGHSRGMQFTGDCEKLNAAVMRGWSVLRFTTVDLRKRPVQCVEEVARLLEMKRGTPNAKGGS